MLTQFITHIIITISCLWSGYLFYSLFKEPVKQKSITHLLISGLVLFTAITQIIVLLSPINSTIQFSFLLLLVFSVVIKRKKFVHLLKDLVNEFRDWSILSIILFIITWLIVAMISAGPTIMDDTESYHIQSIKWIQEYGTVPGLANLHERFGFNTSWFSTIALFNFFPGTSGGFTVVNSTISIWLSYWAISSFNRFQITNELNKSVSILMVFVISLSLWPLIRGNAATSNYDFITTFIVIVLLIESFLVRDKKNQTTTEWITWPVFLFTVRIINFPFILLFFFGIIYLIQSKKWKLLSVSLLFSTVLIIPFFIRNILNSGSPFFPAEYFNWFNVDWKPDVRMTENLLEYIKYYNRVPTTFLEIEQTKALGSNWIPSWFKYLFLYDKILVVLGTIGILLSATILLIQKKLSGKKEIILYFLSLLSLLSWFFISPDPRFVYGTLLFGIFLFVYIILKISKFQIFRKLLAPPLFIIIILSFYYLISKPIREPAYRNWLLPSKLPKPPVQEFTVEGVKFYIPEAINNNWNVRCFGTDLPCLYKIDPRLRLRGKTIREGFRLEK